MSNDTFTIKKNDNLAADATNYIVQSALEDSIDMFKLFLELGADVTTENNSAIIYIAGEEDSVERAKLLIEYGADINAQDGEVLVFSAMEGDLEMVKFAIENGVDVNCKDGEPLIRAIKREHLDVIKYLLEKGADPKLQDCKAIKEAQSPEIVEILLNSGVDAQIIAEIFFKDDRRYRKVDYNIANMLIEKGIDYTFNDNAFFKFAVAQGYIDIIKKVLDSGVPVMSCSGKYINKAIKEGYFDVIELLLNYGYDFKANNSQELITACEYNRANIVYILLKKGVVDANCQEGEALIRAAKCRHEFVVSILLNDGNLSKDTIINVAKKNNFKTTKEIEKMIMEKIV